MRWKESSAVAGDNPRWPPPYKVKKHRLAKSVKLRASALRGLEITTPYRFNIKHLPAILEEHKEWILQHLSKYSLPVQEILPTKIALSAMKAEWKIEYQWCDTSTILIERPQKELVIVGKSRDTSQCQRLLIKWAKRQAKRFLAEQLQILSDQLQLPFKKLTIRSQKTLWGSCTSAKDINLNYKLIFLPPELMRYVMIHELCHTKHLNHSIHFWRLVESFDQNWRLHRRVLRRADDYLPSWLI